MKTVAATIFIMRSSLILGTLTMDAAFAASLSMIAIMSNDLIQQLRQIGGRERHLEKGGFLFHRGDAVTSLFVVVDGAVELIRSQVSGKILVLQRAETGKVLAEASVFSEHYHCDAVAASHSKLFAVPKDEFQKTLSIDASLQEVWPRYLAQQVQQARFRSEVLAMKTVADRLDLWLSWNDTDLPPRGQWQTVAKEIGVSPEALYRDLAKRRRQGS